MIWRMMSKKIWKFFNSQCCCTAYLFFYVNWNLDIYQDWSFSLGIKKVSEISTQKVNKNYKILIFQHYKNNFNKVDLTKTRL